jgi:hypothetical protein
VSDVSSSMLGNKTLGYEHSRLKQTWLLAPKKEIMVVICTEGRHKGSFRNIASYRVNGFYLYHNLFNCDGFKYIYKYKIVFNIKNGSLMLHDSSSVSPT